MILDNQNMKNEKLHKKVNFYHKTIPSGGSVISYLMDEQIMKIIKLLSQPYTDFQNRSDNR